MQGLEITLDNRHDNFIDSAAETRDDGSAVGEKSTSVKPGNGTGAKIESKKMRTASGNSAESDKGK